MQKTLRTQVIGSFFLPEMIVFLFLFFFCLLNYLISITKLVNLLSLKTSHQGSKGMQVTQWNPVISWMLGR